ncbi:MAG: hypothetical protein Q9164_005530 [Protoblastenia rupestris]
MNNNTLRLHNVNSAGVSNATRVENPDNIFRYITAGFQDDRQEEFKKIYADFLEEEKVAVAKGSAATNSYDAKVVKFCLFLWERGPRRRMMYASDMFPSLATSHIPTLVKKAYECSLQNSIFTIGLWAMTAVTSKQNEKEICWRDNIKEQHHELQQKLNLACTATEEEEEEAQMKATWDNDPERRALVKLAMYIMNIHVEEQGWRQNHSAPLLKEE